MSARRRVGERIPPGEAWARPCRCEPNPFQCGPSCGCMGCGCLKERPVLFTGENVVRIFNDLKWQTRRMVDPQPRAGLTPGHNWVDLKAGQSGVKFCRHAESIETCAEFERIACPYGRVGDRLWVRETWAAGKGYDADPAQKLRRAKVADMHMGINVWYRADESGPTYRHGDTITIVKPNPQARGEWRPSIFMPRWASRLQLEVTRIRVEKLDAITEADAIAEGVESVDAYRRLWNEINHGDRRKEWITTGDNSETVSAPWVWCIDFKKAEVTCG